MARNLYAEVTCRILNQLEVGAPPWVKEWKSIGRGNVPKNAVTKRPYSGANVVFLWAHGYSVQRFLTFKQALDCGGSVRKGEHGIRVYFVSKLEKASDDGEKPSLVPFLKEYVVFNIVQCVGLPEDFLTGEAKPINLDERDADVDAFIKVTGADIRDGGEPYFAAGRDFISMPSFESFKDSDCYYTTVFHELAHWSGHSSRLDRDLKNRFGDKAYAGEELVAELCSAFLAAEFGINKGVRHASYIANWIELLRADDRAFFTAASKAQKAADFLRGLALKEDA